MVWKYNGCLGVIHLFLSSKNVYIGIYWFWCNKKLRGYLNVVSESLIIGRMLLRYQNLRIIIIIIFCNKSCFNSRWLLPIYPSTPIVLGNMCLMRTCKAVGWKEPARMRNGAVYDRNLGDHIVNNMIYEFHTRPL